ncbi:MAG: hypothetical protein U0744_06880 [Gemmataceae bacterium]
MMLAIEPDVEAKLSAAIKEQLLSVLSVQVERRWGTWTARFDAKHRTC